MKQQQGYTLIEIMISLLIGLIILGATINIYVGTVGSSANTIKSARLNHDLESVMTLMVNDIKRAGYWGGAIVNPGDGTHDCTNPTTGTGKPCDNPFTQAATNIQIPSNDCILYSYDADDSGKNTIRNATDDVDANEFYGFKLVNNSISIRKTGSTTADCTNGTWEDFIDSNLLTITSLQFSFSPVVGVLPATSRCFNASTNTTTNAAACAGAVAGNYIAEKRIVNIQLTGQVKNDTTTKTLNATVVVRNNRLYTQP